MTATAPRSWVPGAKREVWVDFSQSYCLHVCRGREEEARRDLSPQVHFPQLRGEVWRRCCSSPEAAATEVLRCLFHRTRAGDAKLPHERFSCSFMDSKEAQRLEDGTWKCNDNQAFLPWSKSNAKNNWAPVINLAFGLVVRTPLFPYWHKEHPQ